MTRILVLGTTSHSTEESSSTALAQHAVSILASYVHAPDVRFIDASKLHIVGNLSCYAGDPKACGSLEAGRYRCWANKLSQEDPKKYGGKDQMGVIYDGLSWCDICIFVTSTRWGSHTAIAQNVIERMNVLENRSTVYGEPYALAGKKLGVVVTGLHWKTGQVAQNLLDALHWFGFSTPSPSHALAWQRTRNPYFEHPDNDRPYVIQWAESPEGEQAIEKWAAAVVSA